ncbi:thiamine phosphate synthase [candidate division KSB1 bacterium]
MQRSNNIRWDLYLVTDRELYGNRPIPELVKAAVKGGVTVIQLREKGLSSREFLTEALEVKKVLENTNIPLIINDRIDIALAADADGVHLGNNDMPAEYAKEILPSGKIIGLSAESVEDAIAADRNGADYIGVSPIYTTPTKPELETGLGLQGLRQIRMVTRLPLVAIGGLNRTNAAEVIKNGADGIAVVSAICAAPDPEQAAKELANMIYQAKAE